MVQLHEQTPKRFSNFTLALKIANHSPKMSKIIQKLSQNRKLELNKTQKIKVVQLHEQTTKQFLNPTLTQKIAHQGPKKPGLIQGPPPHKKSQNCFKAAIAFVCTTCNRHLLFALLQLETFKHYSICLPYCNCQHCHGTTTLVWIIATIAINITSLQLLSF